MQNSDGRGWFWKGAEERAAADVRPCAAQQFTVHLSQAATLLSKTNLWALLDFSQSGKAFLPHPGLRQEHRGGVEERVLGEPGSLTI